MCLAPPTMKICIQQCDLPFSSFLQFFHCFIRLLQASQVEHLFQTVEAHLLWLCFGFPKEWAVLCFFIIGKCFYQLAQLVGGSCSHSMFSLNILWTMFRWSLFCFQLVWLVAILYMFTLVHGFEYKYNTFPKKKEIFSMALPNPLSFLYKQYLQIRSLAYYVRNS